MFGEIAPRYDLLNHLLSLSMDRLWRWRTARRFRGILRRPDAQVIDLCCGTGDLTLALERRASMGAPLASTALPRRVLGADFAEPMLVRASAKASRARSRTKYLAADSLSLPFADSSFDLVTAAFGFRNLANYQRGLEEIGRVLKPGGEVGILEFCAPRWWPMAPLYRFYFRQILPRIGAKISGFGSEIPGAGGISEVDAARRLRGREVRNLDRRHCGVAPGKARVVSAPAGAILASRRFW
jgi:demethylmenaquinone methyltransferase/2-methoxy-6-polyprenyl-1,4-benzoquinol methylase